MAELDKTLSMSEAGPIAGHTLMELAKVDDQFVIAFDHGRILGAVNESLEQALERISEQRYPLDFEVFVPVRAIRETISRASKEKDAIVRVQINIYGPRKVARGVGCELSQMKIYLQRPDYVRNGAEYDNPHVLKLVNRPNSVFNMTIDAEMEKISEKASYETLKKTIADVYTSLTRDRDLRGLEGDDRLKTSLLL
jgi:SWI/SNF-related matrix-associated actin-dependent regulator of chromatin subfamily A3